MSNLLSSSFRFSYPSSPVDDQGRKFQLEAIHLEETVREEIGPHHSGRLIVTDYDWTGSLELSCRDNARFRLLESKSLVNGGLF